MSNRNIFWTLEFYIVFLKVKSPLIAIYEEVARNGFHEPPTDAIQHRQDPYRWNVFGGKWVVFCWRLVFKEKNRRDPN